MEQEDTLLVLIKVRHLLQHIRKKVRALVMRKDLHPSSTFAFNKTIISIYRQVLKRDPNQDELIHWNYYLDGGISIKQFKNSLKANYEYDQLKSCNDIVMVNLPTFKVYCRSSDLDVGSQIINSQSFEPHVASVLKGVLKPGSVFVDLGANIGYFSLMASTIVGPTGRVISFEPNVKNLELFYASIVENGMTNIVALPLAASYSTQILRLQSFGSNGFLEAPKPGQTRVQYIQAVVLDEILISVPRIDALKMDIEGFEPLALRGMLKIIEKHKPALVTEFSPWHIEHRCGLQPHEYLEQLAAIGYGLSIIETTGNVVSEKSPSEIMKYWSSLQNDKMQLDLIAKYATK